jgi:hypothetical protein
MGPCRCYVFVVRMAESVRALSPTRPAHHRSEAKALSPPEHRHRLDDGIARLQRPRWDDVRGDRYAVKQHARLARKQTLRGVAERHREGKLSDLRAGANFIRRRWARIRPRLARLSSPRQEAGTLDSTCGGCSAGTGAAGPDATIVSIRKPAKTLPTRRRATAEEAKPLAAWSFRQRAVTPQRVPSGAV